MPARGFNWWWDTTSNPVGGCSYVSPGCTNCFAPSWLTSHTHKTDTVHTGVIEKINGRAVFNGKLSALPDGHPLWTFPLQYPGAEHPKLGPGKPSLIWAADLSDLFAARPNNVISRVCATLAASDHIGLLLTKRTARMAEYFMALEPRTVKRWQPKLWLGFSAEDQQWFDRRWVAMRGLAAAGWFVFVSIAPLLGPVTLPADFCACGRRTWVIVAGEQKIPRTRCRQMKPAWARAIRDQCRASGIPFFMKQMAHGAPRPPDLRIREFPAVL